MAKFKITYFNITGRAEVSRLLLVAAGQEFEDDRVSGDTWRVIKSTTPFGTCPVLEMDGQQYGQSKAIAAFLAKEFGFYGKTNIEKLKIDQVAYLAEDFIQEFGNRYFFEKDEAKKAEGGKVLKEETGPRYLEIFERMLKENGAGYLVGNSMTLADIIIYEMSTGFLGPCVSESMDRFPLVKALVSKVGSHERIKSYMDTRKDKTCTR